MIFLLSRWSVVKGVNANIHFVGKRMLGQWAQGSNEADQVVENRAETCENDQMAARGCARDLLYSSSGRVNSPARFPPEESEVPLCPRVLDTEVWKERDKETIKETSEGEEQRQP